jgi:Type II CAAX prenyl endopeptidase Rce1-like
VAVADAVNAVASNEAVQPGVRAAKRSLGGRGRLGGAVMLILLAQLFLVLVAVDNSPLIPGSMAGYLPDMYFYLFAMLIAVLFIALSPALHTSKTYVNVLDGFPVTKFTESFVVTGLLAGALMGVVLFATGTSYTAVTGAARLEGILFVAFFTASTEEVLFRVALPLHFNAIVVSTLGFAFFHLAVDAITNPGLADTSLEIVLFGQRALAGGVLWLIYSRTNLACAIAAHWTYDGVLGGLITGWAPLGLTHLGLGSI